MGIRKEIDPGGLFPRTEVSAAHTPEEALGVTYTGNHPSFVNVPAAHKLVEEHVNEKFE